MATVQTVTGPIEAAALGRTLMHEHLVIGFPGWDAHTTVTPRTRAEMVRVCVDRVRELQALGYSSLIDPCPNDLGRDVEVMVEVAEATGFNIVCATGLYTEQEGGSPYWTFLAHFGDPTGAMADLFTAELSDGIGSTGVRAGIIKVATGYGRMTDYEGRVFDAAARAAVVTGAPVTTHTDRGTVGDEQQARLTAGGVPAHRIVVGHSCGTDDHDYHRRLAVGGSYLGFDRFGIEVLNPDEKRVASLLRLVETGAGDRIVVSHDSIWCWQGHQFLPETRWDDPDNVWHPTHFERRIVPMLRDGGATDDQIEALVVDNPRRFFEGEALPDLG